MRNEILIIYWNVVVAVLTAALLCWLAGLTLGTLAWLD